MNLISFIDQLGELHRGGGKLPLGNYRLALSYVWLCEGRYERRQGCAKRT
jgi:hypothetical protein